MKLDATKLIWIGSFLVGTLLYAIVVGHYEARIGETDFQTNEAVLLLARDHSAIAKEAQLLSVKQAALDDIARITPQADESHLTSAALREFRAIAKAHHAVAFKMTIQPPTLPATPAPRHSAGPIAGVSPAPVSQYTPRPRPTASPKLVTLPITLVIEGHYGDLLGALADLSRARVLTQVANASFTVVRADASAPRLQMTVSAQLYPPVKFADGQPIVPTLIDPDVTPSPQATSSPRASVVGDL